MTHGTIAIIPARGGSKSLPRKNLIELSGKPLIAWTIEAAMRATSIREAYVSTEDEEIARVAERFGATIIERPAGLATDEARSEDVVLHALDFLEDGAGVPDYFTLLQPTSPLRDDRDIDSLIEAALDAGVACAWSVCEAEHHPWKMLIEADGILRPVAGLAELNAPRQALPPAYRQNGAIYWLASEAFRRDRSFFVPPVYPYVMETTKSIDIDTAEDLDTARRVLDGC